MQTQDKMSGRVALITGAGRGIGKGCAIELARTGATVVINDRPGSPDLDQAAQDIRSLGGRCTTIAADVFSRQGCEDLVAEAVKQEGQVDILVSNPARSIRHGFLECDPAEFHDVINGTLAGGFHMSQLVARHMVERGGGGKMVFISSVHAEIAIPGNVSYAAAKAGLSHMAQVIANELIEHRINVNVIEPGWIDTPGEYVLHGEKTVREGGPRMPWGRLGLPVEIGKAAAFLASDDADYITGSVLTVDGGFRSMVGR